MTNQTSIPRIRAVRFKAGGEVRLLEAVKASIRFRQRLRADKAATRQRQLEKAGEAP